MSDLHSRFLTAAEEVTQLSTAPENQTKLKLYALYKQASEGDATGERPGMMDFVGRAKFDAWAGLKGLDSDAAREKYIALVDALKEAD